MANLGNEFDATQVEPSAPLEPVPPGEYVMQITDSEMKPTKKEDGQYLQLALEITEGDYKGRKVFERLNLDNPNQTAVEIAHKTLSAICHAVGVMKVRDSSQLHYKKMLVRVDVEKQEGYGAKNIVKAYKPLDGAAQQPAAESSAPVTKKPSWAK
jgi:hypothetical protein